MSEKHVDVVVLGAGASGLFCAFTSAARGRKVLVIEKANKVGKKILMSGGGRCNFTNKIVEPDNFVSKNPHFCKSALNQYSQWDFISMVESYAIEVDERKHSQLFCKNSAKEILSMLLNECQLVGVQIKTHTNVVDIKASPDGFTLTARIGDETMKVLCQSLVVATGALSIPSLGGSGYGYDIAKQFGLKLTSLQAGLVPFMFSDKLKPICESLSGLAIEAEVSCRGQSFTENILFTHRGMSGPVMLQISNYWHPGDELCINLLPQRCATSWLIQCKHDSPKSQLKTIVSGVLAKSLVNELLKLWGLNDMLDKPIAELSDLKLKSLSSKLNHWLVKPSATEGYRTAEVTMGGVDTDEISSKTMEAKKQKGLYFIGEVLDVTGHLGGFNFQWAWSSGFTAGLHV